MAERTNTPEERAGMRVKEFTGLMWHIVIFVMANTFFWFIVPKAAIWITIFWGIALIFHVASYFLSEQGRTRRYNRILAEEKERETL